MDVSVCLTSHSWKETCVDSSLEPFLMNEASINIINICVQVLCVKVSFHFSGKHAPEYNCWVIWQLSV